MLVEDPRFRDKVSHSKGESLGIVNTKHHWDTQAPREALTEPSKSPTSPKASVKVVPFEGYCFVLLLFCIDLFEKEIQRKPGPLMRNKSFQNQVQNRESDRANFWLGLPKLTFTPDLFVARFGCVLEGTLFRLVV